MPNWDRVLRDKTDAELAWFDRWGFLFLLGIFIVVGGLMEAVRWLITGQW